MPEEPLPDESSPNASNGNNEYNVSATGTSNNNNSNNAYGVSPDLDELLHANEVPLGEGETAKLSKGGRGGKPKGRPGRPAMRPAGVTAEGAVHAGPFLSEPWPYSLLLKAVDGCAAGVRWKASVAKWCVPSNKLRMCLELKRQLDSGIYRMSPFYEFYVREPKRRLIKALVFRDRVVQRVMCENGLYDDLMRPCIWDNTACQKDKGVKAAMSRLRLFMREHYRQYGRAGFVVRLDISSFFGSLPHKGLEEMVSRHVRRPEYRDMVIRMIRSYPDPGLGLGSQLSQMLAMAYLSPVDHCAREELGVRHYIRYSDDIVAFAADYDEAMEIMSGLRQRIERLGLGLNPKSCFHRMRDGIQFLHWDWRLTSTGRVVVTKSTDRMSRARRHFRHELRLHRLRPVDFQSWEAHMRLGDSEHAIQQMRRYINGQLDRQCRA